MTEPDSGDKSTCGRCAHRIVWRDGRHAWATTVGNSPGVSSPTLCRGTDGKGFLSAHVPQD